MGLLHGSKTALGERRPHPAVRAWERGDLTYTLPVTSLQDPDTIADAIEEVAQAGWELRTSASPGRGGVAFLVFVRPSTA